VQDYPASKCSGRNKPPKKLARGDSGSRNSKRMDSPSEEEEEESEEGLTDEEEEFSHSDVNSDGSYEGSEDGGGSSDGSEDSESAADSSSESGGNGGKSRKRKRGSRRGSNFLAVPPPNWVDGDPPNAGFFLESFTKVYQDFRAFTRLHRNTGLTFGQLIQPCLKPTVLMEIGARSLSKLSQDELLRRIKSRLGFNEEDYYTRKLELLKLPACDQSKASSLYKAFRKLSSPMLRIIKEARDCGVKLRSTNLARIFKNQIRGFPMLERWFCSKKFKDFSEAMRHISTQIHDRIAKEMEDHHDELIVRGQVSGARTDVRGGKSESSQGGGRRNQTQSNHHNNRSMNSPQSSRTSNSSTRGHNHQSSGNTGRPPRSQQDEQAFQNALQKEKDLPQGMYFHPRGPFCKENPCKSKICQGCNYHADAEGRGHIRPNCRSKEHPDFVASGYFHDAHPGKTGALSVSQVPTASGGSNGQPRIPPPKATIRNVAGYRRQRGPKDEGGGQGGS
jgi:hypothetical protein